MWRLKAIILLIFWMSLSSLTAEIMPSLQDSLKRAEKALTGSLQILSEQELKVMSLESQLKKARLSSQVSEMKIATLETLLAEAKLRVLALKAIVKESEAESKRLFGLLEISEQTIQSNAESHLADLEKVKKAHLAETFKIRIGGWLKFGFGITIGAGATYLIFKLAK